ncbi:MAG: lipopolysaccharide biosynthesis protein [Lautropia sp.]
MGQFGHLISGAAWAVGGKILQFLLGLGTLAVVARLVGPESYGIYALSWLALGIFDILLGGAPTETLVQRKVATAGHFNATFWATLLLAVVGWLLVWVSAPTVSQWLTGGAVLAALLPVRALGFVFRALGVGPAAQLMRESRFRSVAQAEMVASALSNIVGIAMAFAGCGIWSLVGMELTRGAIVTAAAYGMTGWRPGLRMCWSDLRDLLAFNVGTWGSWGLAFVRSQLPRQLIGSTLGPTAVGYFALAQRLYEQIADIVMVPAYNVVQAGVARVQDDLPAVRQIAGGILRITSVIACPLFFGLAAIAPLLVPTMFGSGWIEAVPVVQCLMLVGVRIAVTTVQASTLRSMGKPQLELVSAMLSVALAGALIGLALPYGVVAASAAFALSGFLVFPLDAIFVRRASGLAIVDQAAPLARASLAGLAMALGVLAALPPLAEQLPPLPALAILMALGALLYWVTLRIWMPAAAVIIARALVAVARRDFAGVRAALGMLHSA